MPKKEPEIKSLYYITHIDNLPSFFKEGILSHAQIEERAIPFTPIYDSKIVSSRKSKNAPNGKSLWHFANLYFQPRNPMLFRVLHEKDEKDIVILGVQPQILSASGTFLAIGNAASAATEILATDSGIKSIREIWDIISAEWWNSMDGSKRKIMAECLVPDQVPQEFIHSVFVASHESADRVRQKGLPKSVSLVPEPSMFFRPMSRYQITPSLSLADGDMFFSTMQTLTISVNTVGIMGKGLASRAKYQFPDVYVTYQDACRGKLLRMGKPFLYKREAFIDADLADEAESLTNINANKWFLLFATKKHWRDMSDLSAIQEGLRWLADNYKEHGIKSLAIPALGCGLGRLEWNEVGPVMCRELADLDIQVVIYLPREREIPKDLLTAKFLLGG